MSRRYQAQLTDEQKRDKSYDDLEEIRYHVKMLAVSVAVLAGATTFYFFIKLMLTAVVH